MTRVAVVGATGRLGTPICAGIEAAEDLTLVARVARSLGAGGYGEYASLEAALATCQVDVVLEVTGPESVEQNVRMALERGIPVVAGATGLTDQQWEALADLSADNDTRQLQVANFAVGAVLMMRFAAAAAEHMPDAAIIEEHHATKLDRPSGTARHTADLIEAAGAPRPEIHSVRLPGLVAHQEVLLGGEGQLLTIRHDTLSREAFAPGVLLALDKLSSLPPGVTVGLESLLE